MKILIVNTYDKWGAANSCLRLHKGLLKRGIDSKVLLRNKEKNISFTKVFNPQKQQIKRIQRIKNRFTAFLKGFKLHKIPSTPSRGVLSSRSKGLEAFSFPNSRFDITTSDIYNEADIVNLHWVADFLDYNSFFKKNKKPVVWTLHDMNPFSGGEHYLENYLGIDETGFPIKREISEEELSIFKKNIQLKRQALSGVNNLTIVSPSNWLADEARKSEVFKNYPVHYIPYGLDSEIFSNRDKNYSRELLNLPKEKKIILFVADLIDNHRKGFIFLKNALEKLVDQDLILCAIGDKIVDLPKTANIVELGTIKDERLMSVAYSAADVFVIPSLMDNLPNTVLESLMCGTPVIGFPVGGIPEMIQPGFNGLLTKEISVNSLVAAIVQFLNNTQSFKTEEIRNDALKKYDDKVQSKKYIDLYTNIINKKNR